MGVSAVPEKTGALALEDISFEDVLEAPESEYVSDTEQITTFARGDGWYTYTGNPPNHWVLPNPKIYVLRIPADPTTEPEGSILLRGKSVFIGLLRRQRNQGRFGVHQHRICSAGRMAPRIFVESEPTSVDTQGKLTTTWASIKLK